MKIQSTQDYSLFKRIDGNRTVSRPHVERLKEAISRDPSTITYNPVIVNEKWQVIDGQHRFEAMQELELPIHYLKVNDLNLTTVQQLNSIAKTWTPIDYAKSFRELGNENYSVYLEFKHEFGFNHEILMRYMALDRYVTSPSFKAGKFVVTDVAEAYKMCSYLRDFREYYERATLRHQAAGYLYIIRSPKYDHKHFLKKLNQHAQRITEQKTPTDYAREFERIYNYHAQKEPIRLF